MKLTIHGVERQQQRTKLSLRQLLAIFSQDAFVHLGCVETTTYALFYDKYQNKCLIAVIREEHLITVLRLGYNVPDVISLQINSATKHEARVRYYKIIETVSLREVDSLVVRLSILTDKTARHEIATEDLMVIDQEGVFGVTGTDVLYAFSEAVDSFLRRQNLVKHLPSNFRVELKLINRLGEQICRWRYTLSNIIKTRNSASNEYFCVLYVKEKNATFEHPLGLISLEHARSDNSVLHHFSEKLGEIASILEVQLPPERLKCVAYQLRVIDAPTDIRIRLVHRTHQALVDLQKNRVPV
jgi:hypothetical protein